MSCFKRIVIATLAGFDRTCLRARYAAGSVSGKNGGIERINQRLLHTTGPRRVLEQFGAKIGKRASIHGPLIIHNATTDYGNLTIGENVHIGRAVILDLTAPITIRDDATISMGAIILTHSDVGDRPLEDRFPRSIKPTTIGAGSYIGANATVLAGCDIGSGSVIGAGAVVTESIPDSTVAVGVPARVIRTIGEDST